MSFILSRRGGIFMLAVALAATVIAQTAKNVNYREWGITDVVAAADAYLLRGDYVNAIPALEEVVKRMRRTNNPNELETLQKVRFQLARAYYQIGESEKTVKILEDYLANEPRKKERIALRMIAQIYFDQNHWEGVEKTATRLLAIKNLDDQEITTGNVLLGQALFRQKKWAEAIEPLTIAAEKTDNDRTREVMQVMIVRSLVKTKRFRELYVWIPKLYRTDAKYDITLNIAMMEAGKARFDSKDYIDALMLYRKVLPRDVLLRFQRQKIKQLEEKLAAQKKIGMKAEDAAMKQNEINDLKASVKTLEELPPYEDEVTFRIGEVYEKVGRYWEALALYGKLMKKDPTSEIGEAALYKAVMNFYEVDESARAEKLILEYLDRNINGKHARALLSVMMRDNVQKKNYRKVVGLKDYVKRLPPPEDDQARLLQADIHYLMGFGYFLQEPRLCAEAREQYSTVINDFPESPSVSDSIYYCGLTYMFEGDYQNALDQFLKYQAKYPKGTLFPSTVFREGVCRFGMQELDEAVNVFTRFIRDYPNDDLVSEAYSMRADIKGSRGLLDEAIADYKMGFEKAVNIAQASYAVFNAAEVFQTEGRSQEIIDMMNAYIERFKEDADYAQAVYWIGKSQIQLGKAEEAVASYLDIIRKFGNQPDQTGVDKIIMELVELYQTEVSQTQQGTISLKLAAITKEVPKDQAILQLRLKVLLALFEGEEAADRLGDELLRTLDDLSVTTPVSLALMCDAALRLGDEQQMNRVHDYFMKNYEDSDLIWKAYRIKVTQLMEKKEYEKVLKVIEEVQGTFGAEYFMDWAQITKANVLYKLGRYEEAFPEYKNIFGVAEWRGPVFAEAMYGMGRCKQALGDYKKAFAYYQRTYLLYKAYANGYWAAEAYLRSVECLQAMGDKIQAAETLRAMLEDGYVNTLPQAETARKLLKEISEA